MISRPINGWKGLKRVGKVDFPSENGASRTTYVSRPILAKETAKDGDPINL